MIVKRVTTTKGNDPMVTIKIIGTHDISRLLWILVRQGSPPVEWADLGHRIDRSLRRQGHHLVPDGRGQVVS